MASITIFNGANIFARNAILKLATKYKSINLCDFRPYRQSVYELQSQLALQNVQLNKVQTVGKLDMKREIEKSQNILYFAHDYTTMTTDNYTCMKEFAKLTIGYPKQIVCVWPLEFHHFAMQNPIVPELPNPLAEAQNVMYRNYLGS